MDFKTITLLLFIIIAFAGCDSKKDAQNNEGVLDNSKREIHTDGIVVQSEEDSIEIHYMGQMVLFENDRIETYQLNMPKDSNCQGWNVPKKDELLKIFGTLYEMDGVSWHDCYGDWNCGVEGSMMFQSSKARYRLDASGWVIIHHGGKQRYFGCKRKECARTFPSECFCYEQ